MPVTIPPLTCTSSPLSLIPYLNSHKWDNRSGLQAALGGAGLTALAGVVPGLATQPGITSTLAQGNHTVFGPTNAVRSLSLMDSKMCINVMCFDV